MGLTLTEVLATHQSVKLYGWHITDLSPRGNLGLPMDPAGPVGFAAVQRCTVAEQVFELPRLTVLSVYGEGIAPDASDKVAKPGQKCWQMRASDLCLDVLIKRSSILELLRHHLCALEECGELRAAT
jgi:hypothetical protein